MCADLKEIRWRCVIKWRKSLNDKWHYDVQDLDFAVKEEEKVNDKQLFYIVPETITSANADSQQIKNKIIQYQLRQKYGKTNPDQFKEEKNDDLPF